MAITSPKMGLRVWNLLSDPYDHDQLSDNWFKVDQHDHTPGRGVQITTEALYDGSVTQDKIDPDVYNLISPITPSNIIPPGLVLPFASNTIPTGWILADGSYVSRVTYADLFAVIGTTFGVGNGSDTFTLPNIKGSVPLGSNPDRPLGQIGGEATHKLSRNEIPRLGVTGADEWATSSGGPFVVLQRKGPQDWITGPGGDGNGASANSNSQELPHNNIQPYLSLNYIVKF